MQTITANELRHYKSNTCIKNGEKEIEREGKQNKKGHGKKTIVALWEIPQDLSTQNFISR